MAVSKEFHWTGKDGESIDVTFGAAGENVDIDGISLTEVLGGKADKQTSGGGFIAGEGASADSNGVSIGENAKVSEGGGISLGSNSRVTDNGIAIGPSTHATAKAIAIGSGTTAVEATAIGNNANASDGGLAIGDGAKATGYNSIQIGNGTNSDDSTFKVKSYTVLDEDGKIPLDRIGFTQYSEAPVRVGTWIDGTPVWRVAIKHKFTEEELSSSGTMLTDRSWKIPYDEFLADKNGNSCTLLIDYKFILVSNIDYPCLIDDQILEVSGGWFIDFPDGLPVQYFDGIMGWIEFATPESSLKTS